jgi:hypothetical protein
VLYIEEYVHGRWEDGIWNEIQNRRRYKMKTAGFVSKELIPEEDICAWVHSEQVKFEIGSRPWLQCT